MARPARYDRETVTDAAMLGFWDHGYAGCDVETLTRRAGINRHSLYAAFDGKTGLFREALESYVSRVTAPYLAILEGGDGLADLIAYLDMVRGDADDVRGYDQRGCLITNSVTELGRTDPAAAAIIDAYYDRVEQAFAGLIARGQKHGSIRADIDAPATARWLFATVQGISVTARLGRPLPDLAPVVRAALAAGPASQGEEAR